MDTIDFNPKIFQAPSYITLAGPSGSAKTTLALAMMHFKDELFTQPVAGTVYFYSEMQDAFKRTDLGLVLWHHGMPTSEQIDSYIDRFKGQCFLMIFDDMFHEVGNSQLISEIATKRSHHHNFICCCISQNLYNKGPEARTQSLNSHYFWLTRSTRDLAQIGILGSQMNPGKGRRLLDIYQDAVDTTLNTDYPPHLLIACHPFTDRSCQLLTNILPPNGVKILYRM